MGINFKAEEKREKRAKRRLSAVRSNDGLACELRGCKSGLLGTIAVNDNIGDGSWRTVICKQCADRLGLREGDDLK
jgi:hypothetical protein